MPDVPAVPAEMGPRALLRPPLVTGAEVPEDTLGCLGVSMAVFSDFSKIGRPIPSKCVYLHAPAHRI